MINPTLTNLNTGEAISITKSEFVVGRSARADHIVTSTSMSRKAFRFRTIAKVLILEPLEDVVVIDGDRRTEAFAVEVPMEFECGQVKFSVNLSNSGVAPVENGSKRAALRSPQRTMIGEAMLDDVDDVTLEQRFPLSGSMIAGRDENSVAIHLPHQMVSRRHAHFTLGSNGTLVVKDLDSGNGTFVDGKKVEGSANVSAGCRITIGPYLLTFDGTALQSENRNNNSRLVARDVCRVVKHPETGGPLTILDHVNIVVQPGKFVCILGPSGSGKSTLLSVLSARANPNGGHVYLNAEDLHKNFESLRTGIAVVPQKDILHDMLTIDQAWRYAARIRLPADTSRGEIEVHLATMFQTVGLTEHRHKQIRMLSGGQLKRAVLGCEMLARPSLLFLDEVTSGLDEQTDREIMALFRRIAQDKKTVLCVTHNLANVEANCDCVVVLTEGGMLAFIGSPSEALNYFAIKQLGDMYQKLKEKPATQWRDEFAGSIHFQREVERRMPRNLPEPDDDLPLPAVDARKQAHDVSRQIPVLISRYSAVMRADRLNLVAMVGQSVLVALLIVLLFGDLDVLTADDAVAPETKVAAGSTYDPVDVKRTEYSQKILFLVAISCFWFGCNNSVKEIVKEREIYVRERDVNLSAIAYYCSKVTILTLAALLQVTLLIFAIHGFCSLPGNFGLQYLTMLLLAVVGVTSGLLISSVSKSEDAAISAVPILLIPQIILAGFIAPTEGVLDTASAFFVSCHAGYQSASATLPEPLNKIAGFEDGSILAWYFALVLQASVLAAISIFVLMHRRTQNRLLHMSRDAVSTGVKATIKRVLGKLRRQRQPDMSGVQ